GGQGAFIGGVHRIAARLDGKYELVAGALSSDPARAKASAAELGIEADRAYGSFEEMAKAEAAREDGIDVCAIVTPNHVHAAAAKAMLEAGIHVICDKPMTSTLEDANDLVDAVQKSGLIFALTHNYTGYPMIRQARAMVQAGELGKIRVIQVEYPQDWLTNKEEDGDNKQAQWRTDPARSGAGGCIGDIGTHAYNLAAFITGLELDELCADLTAFVEGRQLDDNVNMMLRYDGGARGMLWASQVAPGNENALKVRIFGEKGGLFWEQEHPNQLTFSAFGEAPRTITRGSHGAGDAAAHGTRIPPGHPEGYLEGFANIYCDVAELITARLEGRDPNPMASLVPGVIDGVNGLKFITAAVESSNKGGVWVKVGESS
ncbi:MAG: Gfo/Idh/MocA family oxidoreductase, partial [Rhodospirillaceae bacterium]|nr:Gfo/Idh/MocA family oxidoreductase [Rhodospirillaceae bacterium]